MTMSAFAMLCIKAIDAATRSVRLRNGFTYAAALPRGRDIQVLQRRSYIHNNYTFIAPGLTGTCLNIHAIAHITYHRIRWGFTAELMAQ